MTTAELRDLFDREQRRDVVFPDARRESAPPVVRHVGLTSRQSAIVYSQLTGGAVDDIIRREIQFFTGLGHQFEWKVYDHDQPPELPARLIRHGFAAEPTEALLVLPIEAAPAELRAPIRHDLRRVTQPDQVHALCALQERVWREDVGWLRERINAALANPADPMLFYLAHVDSQPVAAGWMTFHPGSQFAALWGGTTLPEYRRRGLYTALLAARVQEAARRGVRFLSVEARPMSRPILEKRGFRFLGHVTGYRYPS